MARSILDIVIKLSKQGGADRETVKGLVQVKSSLSQVGMVAGVVTGALYAAKKAFEFGKEGAQLQFVEQRFNRLSVAIGANADLMGDLREVTRGLYSDTELMTSASDLMGLGLAKNSDELLRLAKVSSGLNMNMNQLVLTLTNMTTMRFDALGVSVDGFKDKVKALEDAGMSANDAFKEAFLQQSEAQLERVGEAADSTAGSFMRLEAGIKNMADSAKKSFAEGIEPLIRGLADQVEAGQAASAAQEENRKYNDMAKLSLQNLTGQVNIAYSQAAAYAAQLKDNVQATESWDATLMNATVTMADATATSFDFAASMSELDALMGGRLGSAFDKYQEDIQSLSDELNDLTFEQSRYTEGSTKYQELGTQIDAVTDKINASTEAYRQQAAAISFSIAQGQVQAAVELDPTKAQEGSQILTELAYSYGLVDERQKALADSSSLLVEKWAEGNASLPGTVAGLQEVSSAYSGVDVTATNTAANLSSASSNASNLGENFQGLGAAALESTEGIGNANDGIETTIDDANEASRQVNQMRSQISKLDGMVATATVNIVVNGSVPRLGGGGGGMQQGYRGATTGRGMHGRAAGGPLSANGFTIVGDRPGGGWTDTTEVITPDGFVLPNKVARWLKEAGMLEDAAMLAGGGRGGGFSGFGAGFGVGGALSTATRRPRRDREGRQTVTSSNRSSDRENATQSPVYAETVTPLVETTQQAVASVEAAQVQQSVEARQTRAQAALSASTQAELTRQLISEVQFLKSTMSTSLKAAVQQLG